MTANSRTYQAGIKAGPPKPGSRVAGPAVTPGNQPRRPNNGGAKKPQIAVIDNLLTPAALEGLRRFCLEAPVWRASYDNGYLGAFPEHGFACPLLGQIAEELRGAFPAIFRAHPLLYMWGFKYDSQLYRHQHSCRRGRGECQFLADARTRPIWIPKAAGW